MDSIPYLQNTMTINSTGLEVRQMSLNLVSATSQ